MRFSPKREERERESERERERHSLKESMMKDIYIYIYIKERNRDTTDPEGKGTLVWRKSGVSPPTPKERKASLGFHHPTERNLMHARGFHQQPLRNYIYIHICTQTYISICTHARKDATHEQRLRLQKQLSRGVKEREPLAFSCVLALI